MTAFLNKVDNSYSDENTVVSMSQPLDSGALGFSEDFMKNNLARLLTEQYQSPLQASIRETISNALDATNAAGSTEKVKVSLGNMSHVLKVEDKGVGMSKDDLLNHFLHYGSSTKTQDFNSVGAKGIGAKAPLAYADEFTVATVKDGRKTVLVIRKNDGYGYDIFSDAETNEPNGTTVSFKIHDHDINAVSELLGNYKYFDFDNRLSVVLPDDSGVKDRTMLDNYSRVDDFVYHTEDDGSQIIGRMWINNNVLNEARDSGTPFTDYDVMNNGVIIFGGWAYSTDNGFSVMDHSYGSSYYYYSDPRYVVELVPGVLNFPASRDSIMTNKRFEVITKNMRDHFASVCVRDNIVQCLDFADAHPEYSNDVFTLFYDRKNIDFALASEIVSEEQKNRIRDFFFRFNDDDKYFFVINNSNLRHAGQYYYGAIDEKNVEQYLKSKIRESNTMFAGDEKFNNVKDMSRHIRDGNNTDHDFLSAIKMDNSVFLNPIVFFNHLNYERVENYAVRNNEHKSFDKYFSPIIAFITGVNASNASRIINGRNNIFYNIRCDNTVTLKNDNKESDFAFPGEVSIIALSGDTVPENMMKFCKNHSLGSKVITMSIEDVKSMSKGGAGVKKSQGAVPVKHIGFTVNSGCSDIDNLDVPLISMNHGHSSVEMSTNEMNDYYDKIVIIKTSFENLNRYGCAYIYDEVINSMNPGESYKVAVTNTVNMKADFVNSVDKDKVVILADDDSNSSIPVAANKMIHDMGRKYKFDAYSESKFAEKFASSFSDSELVNIDVALWVNNMTNKIISNEDLKASVSQSIVDYIVSMIDIDIMDYETLKGIAEKFSDNGIITVTPIIRHKAVEACPELDNIHNVRNYTLTRLMYALNDCFGSSSVITRKITSVIVDSVLGEYKIEKGSDSK